ncbi:hypothetical protein HID58_041260, partial [Brassica napus]
RGRLSGPSDETPRFHLGFIYKKLGRSSSPAEVGLLRFWDASNVRRGGEFMGVDMLLLDCQASMMAATMNVNQLATHRGAMLKGTGYPDLWPSPSCREPLDVTKNFTFDVIAGILADMRKIFPFEFITWAVMK